MKSDPIDKPDEVPPLGEVLEFMRVIWAVDHGLQKTSKRMGARLGVTGPQRLVIRITGRFPGVSAKQLAHILHIHPSTLTGILRRLEKGGYLQRRTDPRDGRRALLGLTARGRQLDVMSEETVEAAVATLFQALPAEKLRAAQEVLGLLADVLMQAPPAKGRRAQ